MDWDKKTAVLSFKQQPQHFWIEHGVWVRQVDAISAYIFIVMGQFAALI